MKYLINRLEELARENGKLKAELEALKSSQIERITSPQYVPFITPVTPQFPQPHYIPWYGQTICGGSNNITLSPNQLSGEIKGGIFTNIPISNTIGIAC